VIKLSLINTGYCITHEHMVLRGGLRRTYKCYVLVAVLEHPTQGVWLFDTGYAPRVLQSFQKFPFQIYGSLTPVTTQESWSVKAQLKKEVAGIIISHFHADHLGGLLDFPSAKFVCSQEAFSLVHNKTGLAALKCGFIPDLLPPDFQVRTTFITDFSAPSLPIFVENHDLFGDGSVRLVQLPGHARGQLGAWVETNQGSVLLAADGAWHSRSFRENCIPHWLPLTLFFDDAKTTVDTIAKLHRLHLEFPKVRIIPTHCPEIAQSVSLYE
jgi:glyoxylase-like metal-dependent hydrolase (beta-lactamase superfamily II)